MGLKSLDEEREAIFKEYRCGSTDRTTTFALSCLPRKPPPPPSIQFFSPDHTQFYPNSSAERAALEAKYAAKYAEKYEQRRQVTQHESYRTQTRPQRKLIMAHLESLKASHTFPPLAPAPVIAL